MKIVFVVSALLGIATLAECFSTYCLLPHPDSNLVVVAVASGRRIPLGLKKVPFQQDYKFFCKRGYVMLGRRYAIYHCYDYGWPRPFPKCIRRALCSRRHAPKDGYVSPRPNAGRYYKVGSPIEFSCRKGFRLEGKEKDRCGKDGEWIVNDTPTCEYIKCPARMAPDNGFVNPEKEYYSYKDEITFSCQTDPKLYILVGTPKDRCGKDDRWLLDKTPTCEITCPGRMAPRNGTVSPLRRYFFEDDDVFFKCDEGFRLEGEDQDKCQDDGNWEVDETPECVLITCSQRTAPENGRIVGQETPNLPDNEITFECESGYRLEGRETDTCRDDGSWEVDETPECVLITCAQRDAPVNGGIDGEENPYTPTDEITFTCEDGYRLEGTETDTCLDDGSWEVNDTPECPPITCRQRDAPENGQIHGQENPNTPGVVITFTCDGGYGLDGEDTDTCLDSGDWEIDDTPSCSLITCSQREEPENGGIDGQENPNTPDVEITFTCDEGYRLEGTETDTCTQDGTWEVNDTPECILITCPQRDAPVKGGILGMKNPYTPDDEIRFECETGYLLDGTETDTCLDDGSWEVDDTPTCVLITCSQRDAPDNGKIKKPQDQYLPDDMITFECADYYRLVGEEEDVCQDDGTWRINRTPECELILCPELANPENGYYDVYPLPGKQPFQPGSKLRYDCNVHYELKGYPFNKCDKDGQWTSTRPAPECVPVRYTCDPVVNAPRYGFIKGKKSEYEVGDKVKFSCEKPFQINDITYDECLEHGMWKYADDYENPRYPECQKMINY